MPQTVAPVTDIDARGYARPDVLVSTQWVADHLDDPNVRIVESDEDILLYETGHIPGAVKVDWVADLNDPLIRDYIDRPRGERLHMPEYPSEGALRGGHIPGAKSIPWGRAITQETHTFRPADELRTIYTEENGLKTNDEVIVYCRIGERSSHTWFALTYLLGFENVRNYDGSWTEWGNLVKASIEKP